MIRLFQSALNGSTAAARLVLQLIEKAEAKKIEEERNPYGVMPPITSFVLSGPDFEDCSEALRRLDVIEAIGKSYRIPTWVVEAALARNSRNHFSFNATDCQTISENLTNPEDRPPLLEKLG